MTYELCPEMRMFRWSYERWVHDHGSCQSSHYWVHNDHANTNLSHGGER